jgi:ribosome-associated heat shock protein Hsp15
MAAPDESAGVQRLDKWLWFARVVKSRTLAAALVETGKVRVNRVRAEKAAQSVRAGDVLTVSVHKAVRVLKVLAPGERRGPAAEARMLYDDLTPPAVPAGGAGAAPATAAREPGTGRPTKRDRRAIDRLTGEGS